jgi:hypothetical protein
MSRYPCHLPLLFCLSVCGQTNVGFPVVVVASALSFFHPTHTKPPPPSDSPTHTTPHRTGPR